MIVTLTANTTMDQTVFVPALARGTTQRAAQTLHSMGGKPTDASYILAQHNVHSVALGMAAGAIGVKIAMMLRAVGVTPDFVQVEGESRMNVVILETDTNTQTTITTNTLHARPEHLMLLLDKFDAALDTATFVVMGGTLPHGIGADFYEEAVRRCVRRGVPCVLDAADDNLRQGLGARPTFVKPNQHELASLCGEALDTPQDAYRVGKVLREAYDTQPIITLGARGAVALLHDQAYYIPPLPVPHVVSTAGAGDAVLAGLAYAHARKLPVEDGLRLGFATAAAVCMQPGTAQFDLRDATAFLPQVQLLPISGG